MIKQFRVEKALQSYVFLPKYQRISADFFQREPGSVGNVGVERGVARGAEVVEPGKLTDNCECGWLGGRRCCVEMLFVGVG